MDTVYLDPERKTLQYCKSSEKDIPIEIDDELKEMKYPAVQQLIKDLVHKHLTRGDK